MFLFFVNSSFYFPFRFEHRLPHNPVSAALAVCGTILF
jgi:hypothetical protein